MWVGWKQMLTRCWQKLLNMPCCIKELVLPRLTVTAINTHTHTHTHTHHVRTHTHKHTHAHTHTHTHTHEYTHAKNQWCLRFCVRVRARVISGWVDSGVLDYLRGRSCSLIHKLEKTLICCVESARRTTGLHLKYTFCKYRHGHRH